MSEIGEGSHGGSAVRPTYRLTRSALLRGLGLVYASAFGSLAVQLDGLIGSRGILPAAEFLDRPGISSGEDRRPTGGSRPCSGSTPRTRPCTSSAGAAWCSAVLVVGGILPGLCLTLLWLFYLSLTAAGQVFLGYQWDSLLLEAGLLALLLTPWGVRLGRAAMRPGRSPSGCSAGWSSA